MIQLYATLLRGLGVTEYRLELNSIGDRACRPAYLEQLRAWLDEHERELDEETRDQARRVRCACSTTSRRSRRARARAAPDSGAEESATRSATTAASTSPPCARTSTRTASPTSSSRRSCAGSTTTRARRSSSSGRSRARSSTICGGGRYDGLVEEIGGPPTPGIGFGAGHRAAAARDRGGGRGAAGRSRRSTSSSSSDGGPRELVLRLAEAAPRAGVAGDADYAGRSLKGQLTQAQRLGRADDRDRRGRTARRSAARGEPDEPLAHDDVLGRLLAVTWRDLTCGELRPEHVGRAPDARRLGRAPPRPRRPRLRRPARPHRACAARDQPRARAGGGGARARDAQRVRPPRRGRARRALARDGQPEDADRRGRAAGRRRSRSSRARRRCRSSSTRRTSTRRCACATAGSTCAATSCSATSPCARRWSGSSGARWRTPASSTSRRRSCSSRRPRARATSSCPSRLQKGRFYALPQSPQILKQLTMIAGFDRYYQIAICFRDEDLRADRVQEITQLDVEMSFPDQEFLFALMEQMIARIWREAHGLEIATPFPRMTYDEADGRFGTDKPDMRFGLEIEDATEVDARLGVRRLRGRRGGALPARAAGVQPQRARRARGDREGVGREGARLPRLRRGGRGALADREVPLRGRARGLPGRAGDDACCSPPTRGR